MNVPKHFPCLSFPRWKQGRRGDNLCFGSAGSTSLLGATIPTEVALGAPGLIPPWHLPQEKHLGTPCSLKKGPVPDVPLAPKLLLWWRGLDPHPWTKPGSQEGRSCPKD